MTTNQLTKLKDAGFTLEQIIAIGEIFDPPQKADRPAAEKPKPDLMEEVRKAYERGRKEAEDRQRQKEMGPLMRGDEGFRKCCEEARQVFRNSLFISSMETPRRAPHGNLGIGIQTP